MPQVSEAFLTHVIQFMGDDWSLKPRHDWNCGADKELVLTHTYGAQLYVEHEQRSKKLEVRLMMPGGKRANGHNFKDKDRSYSIGLSADKLPDTVAKDIRKRMLPGILDEYDRIKQAVAAYDATIQGTIDAAWEIGRVTHSHPMGIDSTTGSAFVFNLEYQANGADSIRLTIDSLTVEQAKAIIAILPRKAGDVTDTAPKLSFEELDELVTQGKARARYPFRDGEPASNNGLPYQWFSYNDLTYRFVQRDGVWINYRIEA